jgi:hypothetical protein
MNSARSSWWARVVAGAGLLLTLTSGLAAQAEPRPPPGQARLIRIGPQALVSEDARGHVTMVEEPPPKTTITRDLAGLFVVFGAEAILLLQATNELTFDRTQPYINATR